MDDTQATPCKPRASLPAAQACSTFRDSAYREAFNEHTASGTLTPLLLAGDARVVLASLPPQSVDCVMTSPPYWGKREYAQNGIGLEPDPRDYVRQLAEVFLQVKRILKPRGSLWLNIGDSYKKKGLIGLPWRVAFALTDQQGWILRNSVIWNKIKSGMDNSKDRLGNIHEHVFHFVQQATSYYYDADAIRTKVRQARVVKGAVISATGVSGVRYKRQIELSTALTAREKQAALRELHAMLAEISAGRLCDFRMIIRGQQRTTHSSSEKLSGRAQQLRDRGFYFLRYHPRGSKPNDVWDILPEDTHKRTAHYAPYPLDLCLIPILATCPARGIVLDPFCGTGTTLLAARSLGRASVGIDLAGAYLALCEQRLRCPQEARSGRASRS